MIKSEKTSETFAKTPELRGRIFGLSMVSIMGYKH